MQTLIDFFGINNLVPHGFCLSWNSTLLWLHVASDLLITLSYYSIPCSLIYFAHKRKDLPHKWLVIMGAAFILACGTTHLMSAVLIWIPLYWLDGYIKAFTAIISVITAIALIKIIPNLLQFPSAFIALQHEIIEHEKSESQLHKVEQELHDNEIFISSILDSLTEHVAVLNEKGVIIAVNKAWKKFGEQNDLASDYNLIGQNYLIVCQNSFFEHHGKQTQQIHDGIISVLAGMQDSFVMDYECSSPTETRFFVMRVSPFKCSSCENGVVISHQDITIRKTMEQQAKDSQQRFHEIINLMPMSVFIKDKNSNITLMNHAFEEQCGISFEQLKNTNGSHIFPPEQMEIFLAADKKVFEDGKIVELEEWIWNKQLQTSKVFRTYKKPVFNDVTGDYLIGISVDLTLYKQQEKALEASAARFRSIIDISPVPMALHDNHGNITFLNQSFIKTFGYDLNDIPTLELWWQNAYPNTSYQQCVIDMWGNALQEAESNQSEFKPMELLIQHKDGSQKTVMGSAAKVAETLDELHLMVLYDMTEHKNIQLALSESKVKLWQAKEDLENVLSAATQVSIIATDANGLITMFNHGAEKMLGYCAEEMIGKHTPEIFHLREEVGQRCRDLSIKCDTPGCRFNCFVTGAIKFGTETRDWTYVRKDKSTLIVSLVITTIRNEKDVIVGYLGIANDITERKKIELELQRSNTDLEQFAYAISHDMRQPLRMVTSYLSLIESALDTKLDDDTRQFLFFAVDGAKRMDSMIVSLLDYSRVGRNVEVLSLISSRATVEEAIAFLKPELDANGGKIEISGDWIDLVASSDELTRLFQNFIGNALKYHEQDKPARVEVVATVSENIFRVDVRDSGIGINPSQIDRLFKVFSRLQARSRFEGTGVGLALCRRIVEHHGGKIGVESEGEGLGSTFWFELPLVPQNTVI